MPVRRERLSEWLRASTRIEHERVESRQSLLSDDVTAAEVGLLLRALASLALALVAAVERWNAADPAARQVLESLAWPVRRARLAPLIADARRLAHVEVTPVRLEIDECCAPTVATDGTLGGAGAVGGPAVRRSTDVTAHVLGWLYVWEGSTLGGSMIARHLRKQPAFAGGVPTSLVPYGDQTGLRWNAFRTVLDEWGGRHPDAQDTVGRAASAAFDAVDSVLVDGTSVARDTRPAGVQGSSVRCCSSRE